MKATTFLVQHPYQEAPGLCLIAKSITVNRLSSTKHRCGRGDLGDRRPRVQSLTCLFPTVANISSGSTMCQYRTPRAEDMSVPGVTCRRHVRTGRRIANAWGGA
eukprot:227064-Rhodomonas_salina.5